MPSKARVTWGWNDLDEHPRGCAPCARSGTGNRKSGYDDYEDFHYEGRGRVRTLPEALRKNMFVSKEKAEEIGYYGKERLRQGEYEQRVAALRRR